MKNQEELVKMSVIIDLLNNKSKYRHSEQTGHIGISRANDWEGSQGEYNERFVFYRHPELPEGYFLRETYQTDSYANNESIVQIEFVKGREKQVTVFEPIK